MIWQSVMELDFQNAEVGNLQQLLTPLIYLLRMIAAMTCRSYDCSNQRLPIFHITTTL